jgi:hypothetical protein
MAKKKATKSQNFGFAPIVCALKIQNFAFGFCSRSKKISKTTRGGHKNGRGTKVDFR